MSVEQSVTRQFARVFSSSEWQLFKKIAESNLHEAATLKKAHMLIDSSLRLLARNARKRLLIGVGIELLLKAIYLKNGYCINKPQDGNVLKFPCKEEEAAGVALADDRTASLNELIQHLAKITCLKNPNLTIKGLKDC